MKRSKNLLNHQGTVVDDIFVPRRKQVDLKKKNSEHINTEEKGGQHKIRGITGLKWKSQLVKKTHHSRKKSHQDEVVSEKKHKLDDALINSIDFDNVLPRQGLEIGSMSGT